MQLLDQTNYQIFIKTKRKAYRNKNKMTRHESTKYKMRLRLDYYQ